MAKPQNSVTKKNDPSELTRAAAYVRMSTEHQQYSITNQLTAISQYAAVRKFEITKIYEDAGKSGLTFDGRKALQQLVQDILGGVADYTEVLVYDVSRWGRFQDSDEAAYYEHLCRRRGIHVRYCAEPFENDGTPLSVILKAIKRAMAAEFSRELSVKVYDTLCQMTRLGYSTGCTCPYGLKRVVVDQYGNPKRTLERGHQKDIRSDHVVLAPGPPDQVAIVREIFRLYAHKKWSAERIARHLNARGVPSYYGKKWFYTSILNMLENDKYLGAQTYNRTTSRMKTVRKKNDRSQWIMKPGAFPGIVSPRLFRRAQEVRQKRVGRKTDEDLLNELKALLEKKGKVTQLVMRASPGISNNTTYIRRFGSLRRAYALIGYSGYGGHEERLYHRQLRLQLLEELRRQVAICGGSMTFYGPAHKFVVNEQVNGYFQVMKSRPNGIGPTWWLRFLEPSDIDLYLFARLLNTYDEAPIDYYAIPREEVACTARSTHLKNGQLDAYRFTSLRRLAAHMVGANLLADTYHGMPSLVARTGPNGPFISRKHI